MNVPPKLLKMMEIILADLKGCFSFLEDINVYGSTKEEHDERLNAVLNRLQSNGLVANFDKCEFEKTNIEWLGLKLGLNEFAILENNLTSITDSKVFLTIYNPYFLLSAYSGTIKNSTEKIFCLKLPLCINNFVKMLLPSRERVSLNNSNAFIKLYSVLNLWQGIILWNKLFS